MQKFQVTGMSCAACQARVESVVSSIEGVSSCTVNLLTNSMNVEGTATSEQIIKAVKDAGYGAISKDSANESTPTSDNMEEDENSEIRTLVKRLISSVLVLIVLMYFSMGHMMFGWPIPEFFVGNHVGMGLLQMVLTIIIMFINQHFFVSGFKSLFHKAPNMDTLVALGSAAAFIYSLFSLFFMTKAVSVMDSELVMYYMDNLYFESGATILTLITVGKTLEAHSKGKTTNAIKSLMSLAPQTAVIEKNHVEITIPFEQLKKGDICVVRPGEYIPVDGIITVGHSAIDESTLTGESIPIEKDEGDKVSAGTLNTSGMIKCKATQVGGETTLSQIINMVSEASASKAPIAKIADKVSGVFVPIVIVLAIITFVVWLFAGGEIGYAIARGMSVLVISCPCALGLATPVAIMVGNGVGAKSGILFKTATSLEQTGRIKAIALDKTGTITMGTPCVTDVITCSDIEENELITLSYSLEKYSEHPLAKAVCEYAKKDTSPKEVTDFKISAGHGLSAYLDGEPLIGGNQKFMIENKVEIPTDIIAHNEKLAKDGKTALFFAKGEKLLGVIAVADTIKPEAPEAINELKALGLRVVMLTGDNPTVANSIAKKAGVDEVIAEVLPDEKQAAIKKLQSYGLAAMVGDGINDAPALTSADIGIAIGAGTDVAIDAADVVLMKSKLSDVPAAIKLSRGTIKNIHQNLGWAFIYNIIGIPIAAGVLVPICGISLSPMLGAAAMSLSSFCVVSNALRLNFLNIHKKID